MNGTLVGSGAVAAAPAEIRMARQALMQWACRQPRPSSRASSACVAAASVVTNLAAGMTGGELSHQETKDMAPIGGARLVAIPKHALNEGL